MSVRSGFYNAYDHDRRYNALDMANMFDGLISNGIYATVGDAFVITTSQKYVTIGSGRAWFEHSWIYNDSPYRLTPSASDFPAVGDTRWDAIAIETNSAGRTANITMYKGTVNSNTKPTLTDTDWVKYHILYYVKWTCAQDTSTSEKYVKYTSHTNMRGTTKTPFVTGIIEHITADSLITEWKEQWDAFIDGKTKDYDALKKTINKQIVDWEAALEAEVRAWQAEQLSEINAWYATKKGEFEKWETSFKNTANSWYNGQKTNFTSWENTFKSTADTWYSTQTSTMTSWETQFKKDADTWYTAQKKAFDDWFANIKDVIDTKTVTKLQGEIDDLYDKIGCITDAQWTSISALLA